MITVFLKLKKKTSTHDFNNLTDALIFARASSVGTTFQIREGKKLLAKGTIENYKDKDYDF